MNHIDLNIAIVHDIRTRTHMRERDWTGLSLNTVAKRPAPARPQATRKPGKALMPFVITGEVLSHV